MNTAAILSLLIAIATEVGVDPSLAQAVALQENPNLIPDLVAGPNANGTYDYGIMGLNSAYLDYFVAQYWDKEDVFDWKRPEHNIYVGLRHLKYLMDIPGWNAWMALVGFNAGEIPVRSGSPPNSSIEYANRVFARWKKER
jgi:soluble lytic murein transglycosylase-like protein